jgi:ligand-binding sensor domain-containing protein
MVFQLLKLFSFQTLLLCLALMVKAQSPYYKQFGEEDNAPSGILYSTFQDSKGYMWVSSTDGISRYNGQKFENFTTKDGLLKNDVWGFFEDKFGHIWLKTIFNDQLKVQYFDLNNNGIVTVTLPANKVLHRKTASQSLADGQLAFEMIDNETIGIYLTAYFNLNDSYFYAFLKPSNKGVVAVDAPNTVLDLYKNNVIDAPYKRLKRKLIVGFKAIDPNINQTLWKFYNNKWRQVCTVNGFLRDYFSIDANNFLFLTDSTFVFRNKNRAILWHNKKGLLSEYTASSDFSFSDAQTKNLILLRSKTGVTLLNDQLKATDYTARFDFMKSWKVKVVYVDKQQNWWITTEDNHLRIISTKALLHSQNHDLGEAVRHVVQDPLGRLWAGMQSGKVLYSKTHFPLKATLTSPQNGKEEAGFAFKEALNLFFATYIRGLACMPNGDLWIANDQQIAKINVDKSILPTVFKLKDFSNNSVKSATTNQKSDFIGPYSSYKSLRIDNNALWATSATNGLKIGIVKGSYRFESVVEGRCYALQPTQKGIFVGRLDGVYLQTDSARLVKNIPQVTINDLALVKNELYIATQSDGLYCYDIVSHKTTKIRGIGNDNIHKLVIDNDQNLWICSQTQGLVRWAKGQLELVTMADGLPTNNVYDVLVTSQSLTVATAKGITTIAKPIADGKSVKKANLFILKSVRFNHSGRDSTLIFPDNKQKLILKSDENNLVFEINNLNYYAPKSSVYSYTLLKNQDTLLVISKPETKHELRFLDAGDYRLIVSADNTQPVFFEFKILSPVYLRWWFWLLVSSLVAAGIYYRVRLNMKKASLELRALQGQMNAHFAANFMEVVKNLVIKENKIAAFNSLSMFGGLMRDFVVASRNKRISIADEIEFLKRYIELAKLVYGLKKTDEYDKTLTDEISVKPNIDTAIFIRPLILQPIVENVFKYGIFHKEAPSRLIITFEGHGTNTIKCTIEDDGVGRKRVAEIQQQEQIDLQQILTKKLVKTKGSIQSMKEAGVQITTIDLVQGTRVEIILETINIP